MANKAPSLNNCGLKEENFNICSPYIEKQSITGLLSKFFIPKIGILRARLLSLSSIGFGCILFLYGSLGDHIQVFFILSLTFISIGFAVMTLRGYYMFRICKNCKSELAYIMTREPEIKGDYP